jgi:sortase A
VSLTRAERRALEQVRGRPSRPRPSLASRVIGVVGELLITLGVVVLLFVGWQLWWTDITADRAQAQTIQSLERQFGHAPADGQGTVTPAAVPFGKAFAIVRIPRLGSAYARPVLEGTDHDILSQGIGHYEGTAMPGKVGNFAVAGHRTTYGKPFSDIDRLRPGDVVIVETRTSYVVYTVQRHVIVTPEHVEVVAPVPQRPGVKPAQAMMTMTACHPRYSAAQRYVVFASLLRTIPRAQGIPASLLTVPKGA